MVENSLKSIVSYDDLHAALIESGYTVHPICHIKRPYFTVTGTMLKVGDFNIQIYEYPDQASKKRDLTNAIQTQRFLNKKNGSADGGIFCWSVGNLNIIYRGDERTAIRKLIAILGPLYLGVSPANSP